MYKLILCSLIILIITGCNKSEKDIVSEIHPKIDAEKIKVAQDDKLKEETEEKNRKELIDEAKQYEAHCRDFILISGKIMESRQNGMPFEDSLLAADSYFNNTGDDYRYSIMKRMISEAYQQPVYSTSEYRLRQLERFKSEWYEGCIKSFDLEKKRKQVN